MATEDGNEDEDEFSYDDDVEEVYMELQCINEEADPVNEQAEGAVNENEAPEDEEVENQAAEPEFMYGKRGCLGMVRD